MINKEIHQHGYKCLPHDCPLGHPLPGRGLGRLPYYCSRRDAADEMPLKALVLIFVSLPLSPFLVLGASFLLLVVLFSVWCTITKKKFFLCLLSLFRFLQRRCKTTGYKAAGDDRSDSKFKIGILKCFSVSSFFDAFMRQLLEYAA